MEEPKRFRFTKQFLIFFAVLVLIAASWVGGHVLRHAVPSLWHVPAPLPPIPGEKTGDFQEYSPIILGGIPIKNWEPFVWQEYKTDTHYTSYLKKCQSTDGWWCK